MIKIIYPKYNVQEIIFYNFKKYKHTYDMELETANKNNITKQNVKSRKINRYNIKKSSKFTKFNKDIIE